MGSNSAQPVYLGIGNPLLDITVPSTAEYLDKYGLKAGTAVLAEPSQMPMYAECEARSDVTFCAGGSSMNSARALQWMLSVDMPKATAFVGCIGSDSSAQTLLSAVTDAGVEPLFLRTADAPTGKCAVLITNKERTLVTSLGAANLYKLEHLEKTARVQEVVESAKVYYAEGFFVTVSTPSLVTLGERAVRDGKTFMFNISAPFLVEFFWDNMLQVLPFVDFLFCNETEAQAVAKKMSWPVDDLQEVARRMAAMPKKNAGKKRTVLITHGAEETVVCHNGAITLHRPPKCPREEIVDTNGAGDCFVGGFVSQYIRGADIAKCVNAGQYCSWMCLHQVGCRFVGKPDFK